MEVSLNPESVDAAVTLSNNQVFGNTARPDGGGVYLLRSDALLLGNTIFSNTDSCTYKATYRST